MNSRSDTVMVQRWLDVDERTGIITTSKLLGRPLDREQLCADAAAAAASTEDCSVLTLDLFVQPYLQLVKVKVQLSSRSSKTSRH